MTGKSAALLRVDNCTEFTNPSISLGQLAKGINSMNYFSADFILLMRTWGGGNTSKITSKGSY